MIQANRIIISGSLVYENVQILDYQEQQDAGLKNYFEDAQIAFKCKDGFFIIPVYSITFVHLRNRTIPSELSQKVVRITISGEITFQNASILDSRMSAEADIPQIFNELEQFVFAVPRDGIYITADYNVVQIHVR